MIARQFKAHWPLVLGVFSLLASWAPALLHIEYDTNGTAGLFYWACQLLGLPFWAVDECLHLHPVLTALVGLAIFAALDWALRRSAIRRRPA